MLKQMSKVDMHVTLYNGLIIPVSKNWASDTFLNVMALYSWLFNVIHMRWTVKEFQSFPYIVCQF